MKKQKISMEQQRNLWIVIALVIAFVFIGFVLEQESVEPITDICDAIRATPAWVYNGTIFAYGFQNFTAEGMERLIQDEIYFIYSSKCSACITQVRYFGEEFWNKYVETGLTKDGVK